MEAPERRIVRQFPNHHNSRAVLRRLYPVLASLQSELTAQGVILEPRITAAISDHVKTMSRVPDMLSGRTSLKVDSHEGCLTIERGYTMNQWLISVARRLGFCNWRSFGHDGIVLQVNPWLYCWSISQREIPEVLKAIKEITLCPGAEFRGSTFR